MILYTVGSSYYKGFIFKTFVTEDLNVLKREEAREYYKIIHIKSGTCHFRLNKKDYVITGAHALRLNELDSICFLETSGLSARVILFQPQIVNSSLDISVINDSSAKLTMTENQDLYYVEQFQHNLSDSKKILSLAVMDSTIMDERIEKLYELLTRQETSFWPCRSRSYLFEILLALVRREWPEETVGSVGYSDSHSKFAVDIIYYLQSRYNRRITIDNLVEEFHTNRTTLRTEFKKYTGQSINQYLVQLRMNMAAKMLRDTSLTLKEICDRTGFSDISYFSRAFKSRLNLTPSEYRHINKQEVIQ